MYYQYLKKKLFVEIDYPHNITDLIGTARPWKDFCNLSLGIKEKFEFPNHQKHADPGYRLRSRSKGREDKEYFHIYPDMWSLIQADGLEKVVKKDPALHNFFEYASKVYTIANDFALAIGKEIGKEVPGLKKIIDEGKIRSVLRFLCYTNSDEVDVIAAQHFDRSLYTLHLYESAPGLQFLNWDMKWTDAPIGIGRTVVFNGYRIEQLTE